MTHSVTEGGKMESVPIVVTRYKCPHCGRTRATRKSGDAHVGRCYKNAAAKICRTCDFYEAAEDPDYSTGYPGCHDMCGEGMDISAGMRGECKAWQSEEQG